MLTILLDWNRTLYNPEKKSLYQDTIPFLRKLQKKIGPYTLFPQEKYPLHTNKKRKLHLIDTYPKKWTRKCLLFVFTGTI